ncbi:MAG: hypothetical protein IJD65_05585 [Mailhella sp.]|nr:hypothetical protein [Mailhella sp.]
MAGPVLGAGWRKRSGAGSVGQEKNGALGPSHSHGEERTIKFSFLKMAVLAGKCGAKAECFVNLLKFYDLFVFTDKTSSFCFFCILIFGDEKGKSLNIAKRLDL